MPPHLETLDTIGLRCGTDKSSALHDYLRFYETFFAPLRQQPLSIIEIGVFNGASLRTWEAYFPHARILGVDIDPAALRHASSRVGIVIADQSNIEDLTRIAVDHGPFDIVIEDGSHLWNHQITTLRALFPFVVDRGMYIVEDLQTNYGAMAADFRGVATTSCAEYLKSWVDLRLADDQLDIAAVEDPFLRTYGRNADTITFYRRACLIRKHAPRPNTATTAGRPILGRIQGRSVPLAVLAHASQIGDVTGRAGIVDFMEGKTIEGIAITGAGDDLEYRVRLDDNTWSDWARNGAFAGTRGKSRPLTGFAVRLTDEATPGAHLRCAGRFLGTETPIEVAPGQECVAPDFGALSGIEVAFGR